MIIRLSESSWPVTRAGEAMQALAAHAHIRVCRSTPLAPPPREVREGSRAACRTWIDATARCLGLQIESRPVTYKSLGELLRAGPLLLQINCEDGPRFLALVQDRRKRISLIPPRLAPVCLPLGTIESVIAASLEKEVEASIGGILDDAGIRGPARSRALRSMIRQRLGDVHIAEAWRLDVPASAGMWTNAQRVGLPKNLAVFLGAFTVDYVLWIVSWVLLGKWALEGQIDSGWLLGWGLLLLTLIPVRMLAMWHRGKLAFSGGSLVMRLLLEGSFKLKPEEVRYAGVGQLLGSVLEAEALHSLALGGGLSAFVAVIQLVVSAVVLAMAKAWFLGLLLVVWLVLTALLALTYHRRRREWTAARISVTNELVERMIGHATRIAQQARETWHQGEDESLAQYVEKSRCIDRLNILFAALPSRGWLFIGIAAMAAGLASTPQSVGVLAAQLGGIFLAYAALQSLSSALATLSGAVIAAERARDFLEAAKRAEPAGDPAIAVAVGGHSADPLLEMRDVTFRYPQRATDALRHAFLKVEEGNRVLLQGCSGSGKSTLVALTSGVRLADSGLLFLRGIDRKTLGDRDWRRRVVSAPQFHENHIFCGTLAFNLLIGRRWPAESEDLAEAEAICRELGLGTLLDSMPAGLMQMVGETGWQLSNGEKSRVFLARALLQRADLVILDETFAALDPETTQQAIDCVLRRVPTLLCVAHL